MAHRPPGSRERGEQPLSAASSTTADQDRPSSSGAAGTTTLRRPPRHSGDGREDKSGRFRFLKELPILIVVAFVLALLIKSFLVQAFYIPSESMEPTLDVGDRVLVKKFLNTPHPGDIIVFENPGPEGKKPQRGWLSAFGHWITEGLGVATPQNEDFIKRVIGLPGDIVELRHGVVYVNGKRFREPYLHKTGETRDFGPCRVPLDHVFVLGDNRLNSNDSRFGFGVLAPIQHGMCTGSVPEDKIVGRAFVIIWPLSHAEWLSGGTGG